MKARHLAWGLWLAFVFLLSAGTYFGFNPREGEPIELIDALWAWSFIGFPTTGALIASRYPRKPLGWLFIAGPLSIMTGVLVSDTVEHSALFSGMEPWLALVSTVMFSAGLGVLLMVPFFLPNGSLPPGRLRIPFYIVAGCDLAWLLTSALAPGSFDDFQEYTNPIGLEPLAPLFDFFAATLGPLMLLALAVGFGAIVLRFLRTEGQQRLQLKWIALGAALVPITAGVTFVIDRLVGLTQFQFNISWMFGILAIPVTIGIAMLRHHLFEIDRIINRTLVYTLVTTFLVAIYLGFVFALQLVLEPVTPDSDLAIAASTLMVAALIRPARARIQGFIDRRFYRRKYDASRALAEFGTRLRDEVDLRVVERDVLGVLTTALQPQHASLWLREVRAR